MTYDDLVVLIPSHSLEDFPSDLGEEEASSLLNAFAVVWHPAVLASAGVIPSWHRADDPPEIFSNRLFIVPSPSESWLPGGWVERARGEGAIVVSGLSERQEMVAAAVDPLEIEAPVDSDLVADFLAMGSCYLQIELLTRHMHHFSNLDEVHLQREAVSAAQAAISNDSAAARSHLRSCFEVLTEARERFYPVECYLIDLCLLIPRLADDHLGRLLSGETPVNILATGSDLKQIADENPALIESMRSAWHAGIVDVLGGELREPAIPLLPIESVLWSFEQGHAVFRELFDRVPTTWGRHRYGLATLVPQILKRFDYQSAMHVVLDDGIYPDAEQSKIQWEGCDGSVVDAITRIPLAADSASSFLRFSARMAESMESDQVAALVLARWPEVKTPWMEDMRRMNTFSPALGSFITFANFFDQADDPGRLSQYEANEYLSPFLVQAVAGREQDAVSRFVGHLLRRRHFDVGCWYHSLASLLGGKTVEGGTWQREASLIEEAGPDSKPEDINKAAAMLDEFIPASAGALADVVMQGAGNQSGVLLLNPLSFPRTVTVDLPEFETPPRIEGSVKAVQFDENRKTAIVSLPASGYLWIPSQPTGDGTGKAAKPAKSANAPTAEPNVLRNEFFEVYINEETGCIGTIKGYGRSPNRLSQQLAYRFPRERSFLVGEGDQAVKEKSFYSQMRCLTSDVTSNGSVVGEIVTTGEIIDPKKNSKLAGFRQTFRIYRGRPVIEIEIELDIERMPEGDPWSNYYAVRFAWNDGAASLTRSILEGAHRVGDDRFESPYYLEIAAEKQRTTILNMGLPFHRKTGPRMVDSLLVVEGETQKTFRFVVAIDSSYPMQEALDALSPVAVIPTEMGPPRSGTSGWFFHLDAKNVQISRILEAIDEPPDEDEPWRDPQEASEDDRGGYALRLVETEGRNRTVKLRCFKTPGSARQRDLKGRTITDLNIEGDSVQIQMTAYEIADIELRFAR